MSLGELIDNRDVVVLSTGRNDPFFLDVASQITKLYSHEKVLIAREGTDEGRLRVIRHKHDDTEGEPKFKFINPQFAIGDALAGRKVILVSTQGSNPSFAEDFDFKEEYERLNAAMVAAGYTEQQRGLGLRLFRHGYIRSVPEASDAKITWADTARENGADAIYLIEPCSFRQASDRGPWSRENKRIQERGDPERAKLDGLSPGLPLEARLEANARIAAKLVYHPHSLEDMTFAYRRAGVRLVPLDPVPMMALAIKRSEELALSQGQPKKAVLYVPDQGAVSLGMAVLETLGLDYFSFIVVEDKIKNGPHTVGVRFGQRSNNYEGCAGARVYCCDDQIRSAATVRVGINTIVKEEGVPTLYRAIASHADYRSPTTQRNLLSYGEDGISVPIQLTSTLSKPQALHVCGPLLDSLELVNQGRLMGDAAVRCLLLGQKPNYSLTIIEAEGLCRFVPARQMYEAFKARMHHH